MCLDAVQVVVGLGANIGDPLRQMERAVGSLRQLGELVAVSGLFSSAAIGGPTQPDYLNAAVLMLTPLSPEHLLPELLAMERRAGRERRERWGPRLLDLDILWSKGFCIETTNLTVPHPRLLERAFAMLPLVEVAPNAREAHTGKSYEDCISTAVRQQDCRRIASWSGRTWQFEASQRAPLRSDDTVGSF